MSAAGRRRVYALAGIVLLVISGCGLRGPQVPKNPLFRLFGRSSGHLAYVGVDGNLYVTDQSGSTTQLTHDSEVPNGSQVSYVAPTWGPAGERIAFARYVSNPSDGTSTATLDLIDKNTQKVTTLLSMGKLKPFHLDWSPNGEDIALVSDAGTGQLEFGVASSRNSNSYRRLDSGSPYYWTWSRDSTAIVAHTDFTSSSGGRLSLFRIADPGSRVNIQQNFGFFRTPAVLPDGDVVAALRLQGELRLAAVNPSSGVVKWIGAPSTSGFLYVVSPDGKFLADFTNESPSDKTRGRLQVIELSTGKVVQMITSYRAAALYWSPDSTRLAVFAPESTGTVPQEYAQIASLPHVNLVVLQVGNAKSWEIATFPPTQGLLNILPYSDQYERSQTIWSPDGRHLVFTAYAKDGLPGIFVADSSGKNAPVKIASGDNATWSPK